MHVPSVALRQHCRRCPLLFLTPHLHFRMMNASLHMHVSSVALRLHCRRHSRHGQIPHHPCNPASALSHTIVKKTHRTISGASTPTRAHTCTHTYTSVVFVTAFELSCSTPLLSIAHHASTSASQLQQTRQAHCSNQIQTQQSHAAVNRVRHPTTCPNTLFLCIVVNDKTPVLTWTLCQY